MVANSRNFEKRLVLFFNEYVDAEINYKMSI